MPLPRNIEELIKYFRTFINMLYARSLIKQIIKLYSRPQIRGSLSAHWAKWYEKRGVGHCKYYRQSIIDNAGENWRELRDRALVENIKPKIIMVGSVGSPMYLGLRVLVDHILDYLDQCLGSQNYEIHLIGKIELPSELKRLTKHPSIVMRGYVEDIDFECLSADVLLVPTPERVGVRTRLVTGLSYGCCIVTTEAEVASLPVLKHMQNALIAKELNQLGELVVKALKDPELKKRIGDNARLTYEESLCPDVAIKDIEEDMKRLTGNFIDKESRLAVKEELK